MKIRLKNSDVRKNYQEITTCTGYKLKDEFVGGSINTRQIIVALIIAALFWGMIFGLQLFNFWLSISIALCILAIIAVSWGGWAVERRQFDLQAVLYGLGSAVLLYLIFFLGNYLATWLFAFAPEQISGIYSLGKENPLPVIILLLIFVTSPCEEIFWRGFIQRGLTQALGGTRGWLLGAVLYATVHIFSGNFMLVLTAFICGLFWGYLYKRERNIAGSIISHAIWAVVIFVILPITPHL